MALSRGSTVGIVGAGFVGGSLAIAMSERGYGVTAVASRRVSSARSLAERIAGCRAYEFAQEVADASEVVFVTTPDDLIAPVVGALSWRSGQGVVHCSGAATLEVLEVAARQGALAGAFHPLQAFSSIEDGARSLPGTTFGIDGNEEMRTYLQEVALAVGGTAVFIKAEDKTLYHASGVLMGNLLTVLGAVAAQMWDHIGSTRAEGVTALAPMMRQVSRNLETSGIPGALAGPYVRGDLGTVQKHLTALSSRAPDILPLYCELALAGLAFTREKGVLPDERIAEIRRLVEAYNPRTSSAGSSA